MLDVVENFFLKFSDKKSMQKAKKCKKSAEQKSKKCKKSAEQKSKKCNLKINGQVRQNLFLILLFLHFFLYKIFDDFSFP